jgi:hypothetical protein
MWKCLLLLCRSRSVSLFLLFGFCVSYCIVAIPTELPKKFVHDQAQQQGWQNSPPRTASGRSTLRVSPDSVTMTFLLFSMKLIHLKMMGLTPCHSAAFAIASRGPLQWHHRQTKFHPNLLSASKLNREKQTNIQTGRQTDDLINLRTKSWRKYFDLTQRREQKTLENWIWRVS